MQDARKGPEPSDPFHMENQNPKYRHAPKHIGKTACRCELFPKKEGLQLFFHEKTSQKWYFVPAGALKALSVPAPIKDNAFYTTGFFTSGYRNAIVMSEIRAMPGKEKEMILRRFSVSFKSEYQDRSLCSFYHKMHGPSACPYKTENRTGKRQPE